MRKKISIPAQLEPIRDAARRALGPVVPANSATKAEKEFLFDAQRTDASGELPPYYLVYFLLVDLLQFENLGQFEKISWSVPIDFHGKAFLIEHRKFGIGVFAADAETDADAAREIASRINKAVKVARPFFDWLAEQAAASSTLNVINNSESLLARFTYFRDAYRKKAAEAEARKDEFSSETHKSKFGGETTIYTWPSWALKPEARWLALATIESFFSWTEHVFIHLGILSGKLLTGAEIAKMADSEWSEKFKCAFDLSDPTSKQLYDQLLKVRRGLRNFVAHGAFGKDGQAFQFHSGAGAVPLLLPHKSENTPFRIGESLTFDDDAALVIIDKFTSHLWSGPRAPAELYLKTQLPVILTKAVDGTYARAMSSLEDMTELVDHLSHEWERAANMDW